MLLKEDIDMISNMPWKDIDKYLESNNYDRLSENDKIEILRIITSKVDFEDDKDSSFEEFAENIMVQERIFDLGIELNENNYRKIRKEIRKEY